MIHMIIQCNSINSTTVISVIKNYQYLCVKCTHLPVAYQILALCLCSNIKKSLLLSRGGHSLCTCRLVHADQAVPHNISYNTILPTTDQPTYSSLHTLYSPPPPLSSSSQTTSKSPSLKQYFDPGLSKLSKTHVALAVVPPCISLLFQHTWHSSYALLLAALWYTSTSIVIIRN